MANNKDKIRASAQKFLQKGQIDKAIREFQRLIEEDPKDVRTLLKIGDLQTRIGNNAEATQTYGLVAQFYSDQGFFLKAVAVYKQILKLDPNLIEVNLKLADLYHQLGLMSDAANQYRQISQLYENDGKMDQAIKVLARMIDLDPENVASRIKLAETYAKQQMLEEARTEFQKAAQFLKSHQRVDDYAKVAERIIHFDPNDLRTTKELANIYIQKGDARRALAKLQVCFKANPKDVETLGLLAIAFKELEQPQKTISVYRELARIHEAARDQANLHSVMRKILAVDPQDAEALKVLSATPMGGPPQRSPGGPPMPPPRRSTGEMSAAQVAAAQQALGTSPPPRRQTQDVAPAQVAAAQALALPPRRVTGDMSPAQVAAVQAVVGQARRNTGEPSPAQVAQMQGVAQGMPQNALGRIVPAQRAVPAAIEAVREVDRRPPREEPTEDFEEVQDATPIESPDDGLAGQTRETVSRILVEAEVYVKYGLKQKAVEHLRKIFAVAPDHRETRVRYKNLLIELGDIDEALNSLLGMAAVSMEQGKREDAKADLIELLELEPNHRRARDLLAKLAPASPELTQAVEEPILELDDDLEIDTQATNDYVPRVELDGRAPPRALAYEPSAAAAEIDLDGPDELQVDTDDDEDGIVVEVDSDDEPAPPARSVLDEDEHLPLDDFDDLDEPIAAKPAEDLRPPSGSLAAQFAAQKAGQASVQPAAAGGPAAAEAKPRRNTAKLDADLDALISGAVPSRTAKPSVGTGRNEAIDAAQANALKAQAAREAAKAEAVRGEAARAETARVEAEQTEILRTEAAKADAARADAARVEASRAEASRAEAAKAEAARAEAARIEAERAEAAAIQSARAESERIAAEADAARIEAERTEAARTAAEAESARIEQERIEAARIAAEHAAAARAEAERAEAAKAAAIRAEAARVAADAETARLESERTAAEAEATRERAAADAEAARLEATKAEAARVVAVQAEEAALVEAARGEAQRADALLASGRDLAGDASPTRADLSAEIAEVGFYLEQGLDDEARDLVQSLLENNPDHPELLALAVRLESVDGTDYASAGPAAGAQSQIAPRGASLYDDEAEPEPEMHLGDLALDIGSDLQAAAAEDADLQVSLDDVFNEFKRGVAESVEDTDYATHYDLGIAYKEMSLLDDAIREFELAARDPSRAIGALTMMGICALQNHDTEHALAYFLRGLNAANITAREAMALRYEIGAAYESDGRYGESVKFYEKVNEWDTTFRDVRERLTHGKEQAGAGEEVASDLDQLLTETEAERASRSKISYV